LKIENGEWKVNMEEKATQRGVSAYKTWSVEKDGVQGRGFPYGEAENCVKNFQKHTLGLSEKAHAVLAIYQSN
jgi:hypothetical protein